MPALDLIIFDFDGVVADSETICNALLAEMLTGEGLPTTMEDALKLYCGRRWAECQTIVEGRMGRALPTDFGARREAEALRRLTAELEPVPGVVAFLDQFSHMPRCIGSSSTPSYLAASLKRLGLEDRFGPHVFSAAKHVTRGKPHPDIFLYAAAQLGDAPTRCLVIEDSPHGVEAGVAAGMLTIGLCAASHVRDGLKQRLFAAGAHHVVDRFEDIAPILSRT